MTYLIPEDPASLRHVAAQIRANADELCAETARVQASAAGFDYQGPAAATFFQVLAESKAGVHAQADALYALAQRLEAGALEAEAQLRAGLT
jgi:hypothetical protein